MNNPQKYRGLAKTEKLYLPHAEHNKRKRKIREEEGKNVLAAEIFL